MFKLFFYRFYSNVIIYFDNSRWVYFNRNGIYWNLEGILVRLVLIRYKLYLGGVCLINF